MVFQPESPFQYFLHSSFSTTLRVPSLVSCFLLLPFLPLVFNLLYFFLFLFCSPPVYSSPLHYHLFDSFPLKFFHDTPSSLSFLTHFQYSKLLIVFRESYYHLHQQFFPYHSFIPFLLIKVSK